MATRAAADGLQSAAGQVLAAAKAISGVVLQHRVDLRRARDAVMSLLAELRAASTIYSELDELLQPGATGEGSDGRRDALRRLFDLHGRIGSMQRLTDSLVRLQAAELRAFGITDGDLRFDPMDLLSDDEIRAEIERLNQWTGAIERLAAARERSE